jgi:hypothetical protein
VGSTEGSDNAGRKRDIGSIAPPYVEHVPPDTTAAIFWLKNRDPAHWRSLCEPVSVSQETEF